MLDIITKKENFESYKLDERFILFDIETSGLNPKYSKVRMMTYTYLKDGEVHTTQTFCSDSDEKLIIFDFIKRVENKFLITYNGSTFDIPFIQKRAIKHGYNLDQIAQFDIYKNIIVKRFKSNDRKNLKNIEEILGIRRSDEIDGKQWIDILKLYDNSNIKDLVKLYLHNYEDVINMYHIIKKMNIEDLLNSNIIKDKLVKNIFYSANHIRIELSSGETYDLETINNESFLFFNANSIGLEFKDLEIDNKKRYLIRYQEKTILENIKYIIENYF